MNNKYLLNMPEEIMAPLKKLCIEQGALIYGGSSLILRSTLLNNEHYRLSADIDIKTIEPKGKKSGPSSQFDPSVDIVFKEMCPSIEKIIRIENDGAGRNINYEVIFDKEFENKNGIKRFLLELRHNGEIDEDDYEIIDGYRVVKLAKILADKIFATLDYYSKDKLLENNLSRHLVDSMLIVDIFNIENIDLFKEEVVKFLSKRIVSEKEWIKTKDVITRKTLLASLSQTWEQLVQKFIYDENDSLDTINETYSDNPLYVIDYDIFSEKRINLITNILNKYEKI